MSKWLTISQSWSCWLTFEHLVPNELFVFGLPCRCLHRSRNCARCKGIHFCDLTRVTDWIARNWSVGECVDRSSHRSVVGSNLSPLIPHAGDHAATTRCNHRSSLTTSKCKCWRPSIISVHKCATTHITVQKHLVWDETFPQFLSWIQIPANLFSAFHIHRFTCKTCTWHSFAH